MVNENGAKTALATVPAQTPATIADEIQTVVAIGDLSKLSPDQRAEHLLRVCRSLGLNPLTQPFQYLYLNGKLVLYATRGATDQLRSIHHISLSIIDRKHIEDVYVVTAHATTHDGRFDESTGAVTIGNLRGDALANALMKAETKSKRRVTLSICGLGMLDESELETIPNVRTVDQVETPTKRLEKPVNPIPKPTKAAPTPKVKTIDPEPAEPEVDDVPDFMRDEEPDERGANKLAPPPADPRQFVGWARTLYNALEAGPAGGQEIAEASLGDIIDLARQAGITEDDVLSIARAVVEVPDLEPDQLTNAVGDVLYTWLVSNPGPMAAKVVAGAALKWVRANATSDSVPA